MKKLILAAGVAAFVAAPAGADVLDYAQLTAGATQSPDLASPSDFELDVGYNVGGAFGWHLTPQIDLAVDFFYTESDFKGFDSSIEAFSGMVNGAYNFDIGSSIKPYVGLGLGFMQVKANQRSTGRSDSEIVFGYQGSVGFTTSVDDKTDLVVEYRYHGAADAQLNVVGTPYDQEYKSHNLSVGFRFNL